MMEYFAFMKAELLARRRIVLKEAVFAELLLWKVSKPVRGSGHVYKYSLALVSCGVCVIRYDNEAGKGDHKHIGEIETAYRFIDIDRLMIDFRRDVERWLDEDGDV